ncbi:MAG: HD domain-containing protein [Actinomycetota bacterium]|nr:HD domain-containing protein [Actinomycetota bacterium]
MLRRFSAADEWPPGLDEAVTFAVRWHADQTRPAGEPYVEHLKEATAFLAYGAGVTDQALLRAAVLHDVVEDTDCTLTEVRDTFGDKVATLVDWVTKGDDRAAYLARLREAPVDALLVKLADRASNVQRLDTHPRPEKQRKYYAETVRSIVPLSVAHPWFAEWYATWQREFAHLAG